MCFYSFDLPLKYKFVSVAEQKQLVTITNNLPIKYDAIKQPVYIDRSLSLAVPENQFVFAAENL